jgi:hypothetical protein
VTRLRAALTALALVVTVLLGGCAQTADTTAVVNGVVIRENTVNDMAQALVSSGAYGTYAEARSAASSNLIVGEVARQVARQDGISLTPADISSLSANNPTFATFLSTPLGEEFATDHTNGSQVINQVTNWQTEFEAVNVDLNPRYGTWTDYISSTASTPPTGSMSVVSGS